MDQIANFYGLSQPLRFLPTLVVGGLGVTYFVALLRRKRADGKPRFPHLRSALTLGVAASVTLLIVPAAAVLYRDVVYPRVLEPRSLRQQIAAYIVTRT